MREIKFMAWHKEKNILREVFEISFSGGYVILAGFGSFGEIEAPIRDVELMQYTGLKDKNGVEIYDGYIPRFSNGSLGEVIWSNLRAGFDVAFSNAMPEELDNNLASDCVVVGNIYENPEILKDTK